MQSIHENDHSDDGADSDLNIPLFLLFLGLGLAGNYFRYDIFFNIEFMFGSIFAMLALQFFGMRRGVLAAGLISLVTYLLWNHPYAIIIMTCEALLVGVLVAHRKVDLVTADALYWLFIGIPLVFLFYYGIMHVPLYLAEVTMMKQAVNGIANALIARLLFVAMQSRTGKKLVTFQEMLFNLLAFAVLTVSLFLLIHQARHDFSETDQAIRGSLNLAKQRMSANLDTKLAADVNVIAYLARIAPHRSPQAVQQSIEQAHAMAEDFLRIGVLDRSATIISFSPLIDDLGRPQMGKNYADRPFIPLLKRDLKPMLTDVEMSRFGAPRPRAGIVAPVLKEGRYSGFAIGVLDLERLREPLALNAKAQIVQNLIFTLVDKHNKVIVTSRQGLKAMDPFARGEGELRRLDDGIAQWLPAQKKNISISERWKHSSYVAEQPIGSGSEWKLIVELPIAPFQQKLLEKYAASLVEVFALLLVVLIIARHISRSAASSLEQLAHVASTIPSRLASVESLIWPRSAIKEIRDLIRSFRDMAQVMAAQFQKIGSLNESLEQRINERTQELRESEERFRALIESTSDWIWEVDKNGRYRYSSPRVRELLGYAPEEMIGKTPFETMPPEEARRVADEFSARIRERRPLLGVENINLHKDGRIVVLETSGVPIIDADGQVQGYRGIDRDITKRKRAEEEVKRLANEQQTILNTVAIGVAFVKDRKLVWTNPAYERIFGYGPGEARGLDAKVLYVDPADYERVGREGYPVINAGKVYTTEVFSARKEGSTFWLSLTGRAVSPDNAAAGSIWIMQDITERKASEEALRQSEERLSRAQRVAKVGNWEWNIATNELAWSDEVFRIYGLDPAQDKPSYEKVICTLAPECHDPFTKAIEDALRYGAHFEGEYRIILPNGEARYTHTVGEVACDAAGRPLSMFGVVQDITERKHAEIALAASEKKYRFLIENLQEGLWMIDREGTTNYVNQPLARMLGYTTEEMLGRHLFSFMDDHGRTKAQHYLERRREGVVEQHEFEFVRKDGKRIYTALVASPFLDEGGNYSGALAGLIDISERKSAELELQEKTRQLEALTRDLESRVEHEVALRRSNEQMLVQQSKLAAMGEMLGAIAHQWRQPLNILGLIVQNLEDAHAYGKLDKEYLERTVQKSMAQIMHMSKTIDDFRNFYRPDKEKTDFDAMRAVGDVLALFTPQLHASGIHYRLTCHTHGTTFEDHTNIVSCPEKTVTGYRNEFEHAILNLVSNARESILENRQRSGGPANGFLGFDFHSRGGKIVIQVSDNGGGIDRKIIGRIFEPYFTSKDPAKGTGLGLYMSKVIIEDHMGGALSASNGEQGAVFTIELEQADAGRKS